MTDRGAERAIPTETETISTSCACGWSASGPVDEVVDATAEHGLRLHNMAATREQILAQAVRGSAPPAETGEDSA